MSRGFNIKVVTIVFVVASCCSLFYAESFPDEQRQQQLLQTISKNQHTNNNNNKPLHVMSKEDDALAATTSPSETFVSSSSSPSILYLRSDVRDLLDEDEADGCEKFECGAECYPARDQGCGWSQFFEKCINDTLEVTTLNEFSMGKCVDCHKAKCGRECKELESKGCSWGVMICSLDPRSKTTDDELNKGTCSNATTDLPFETADLGPLVPLSWLFPYLDLFSSSFVLAISGANYSAMVSNLLWKWL